VFRNSARYGVHQPEYHSLVILGVLNQTTISGTGITVRNFTVGSNCTFILQSRDVNGNDICSQIAAVNFTIVPEVETLDVAYIGNGQYQATINATLVSCMSHHFARIISTTNISRHRLL
jgi:hypothetical protein